MNSRVLIIGLIAIVVFATFLFRGKINEDKVVQGVQNQAAASDVETVTTLDGQVKSMGAVEVEIAPISVVPDSNMVFDVSLNTHSVDLSYDYTKIISAEDDQGNIYKVVDWSGGEGGHHLSGQVELEPLSKEVNAITLMVDGIDNQKETFEWDLN